ncbi:MAG: hypothetical protein US74_C0005G0002 [Parcubacteria group bacterium GW2011_GWA2_38_13]|nr:MAG: hypothetical protein US74_C0005G0002 [Parcubacteria group bacterium GW2011_GWA2_38_13]
MVVFLIVKVAQRIVCRRAEQDREVVRGVKSGACQLLARDQDGARCRHVRHREELTQAVLPASICAMVCVNRRAIHTVLVAAAHLVRVQAVKSGARALLARDQDGAKWRHVRHREELTQAVQQVSICAITHALPMAQHAIIIHIIRREIQRLHSALPEHIFASIPIVASQTVRRAVAPKQLNSPRRQQSVAHSARFRKMGNA